LLITGDIVVFFGAFFVISSKITPMKHVLVFAFMFVISALSFSQTQLRMIIHPDQVDCQRMMQQKCFQVRINDSKEWTLFYERIIGFNFEPGYRYELLVIETKRPEPLPADLSAFIYKLEKVISKTAVVSNTQQSNWKIMELKGQTIQQHNLSIQLDPNNNSIAGYGGCNRFFGTATWNSKKTKVTIGDLASTRMFCENKSELEGQLLSALSGKTLNVSIKNEEMYFKLKRKTVLSFRAQPLEDVVIETDEPREDVTEPITAEKQPSPMNYFNKKDLKLIQINKNAVKTVVPETIRFDLETKTFTGNGGCNRLFGAFTFENNTITIENVNATKMLCMDESVTQLEKAFIANLNLQTLQVDYAEQVLNCYNANGELILMFAIQK
jgi:heat shock protein HslJ